MPGELLTVLHHAGGPRPFFHRHAHRGEPGNEARSDPIISTVDGTMLKAINSAIKTNVLTRQ